MKVLFLDVDGVLNRCGKSAQGLEQPQIEELDRVLRVTGAVVVLSSTWRKFEVSCMPRLRALFAERGWLMVGKTPVLDRWNGTCYEAVERGMEIQAWLDKHPEVERFAIVDDCEDMAHLRERLVRTLSYEGLRRREGDELIGLLGKAEWEGDRRGKVELVAVDDAEL